MGRHRYRSNKTRVGIAFLTTVVTGAALWAVAPNALAAFSTTLSVSITSPANNSHFTAGSTVTLNGSASIGAGTPVANTALATVIDMSGSTSSSAGGSCGGDVNADMSSNDVLDCEDKAAVQLNETAASAGTVADVGMGAFGADASTGDVGPGAGAQLLTAPATDGNTNGIKDIEEVFTSVTRAHIGKFTNHNLNNGGTNFALAVSTVGSILSASSQPNRIGVLLSDGVANAGGSTQPAITALPAGTKIYTFAVGSGSACGVATNNQSLQYIADHTGGTCTKVTDPTTLPSVVPALLAPQMTSLQLIVDSGTPTTIPNSGISSPLPQPGPKTVTYTVTTPVLHRGTHSLCVKVNGTDAGGTGSAQQCINVIMDPIQVTVTANNQTKTYGAADPTFTATVTGASASDIPAFTCGVAVTHTHVGGYPIHCSGATDSGDYHITYVDGTLTIGAKTATINADNQSKTYGQADPPFTFHVAGLLSGDTLDTAPTCSVAVAHVDAGTYPITCTGGSDADYTVVQGPAGTLTINRADVNVTAPNLGKTFGAPDPSPITPTITGLVGSDTIPGITCSIPGAHEAVGAHPIKCTGPTQTTNYNVHYFDGTLTVSQAQVVVTAPNLTKVYGDPDPSPITPTVTGLATGDSLNHLTCTIANPHVNVGSYVITCTSDPNSNYTIQYVPGSLQVTSRTVTVTPNNQTKVYGQPDPPFTASTSGLVNGDTLTSLNCSAASPHVNVGTYPITCTATASSNYTVQYGPAGTLTITKATPTVTTTPSGTVPVGGNVSDSAALTNTDVATGTVTFQLYAPGDTDCTTAIATRTGTVTSNHAASGNVGVIAPGVYRWVATYNGDGNNNMSPSACGTETVVVTAQVLTGRAYDLSVASSLLSLPLLNIAPVNDTGHVSTTASSLVTKPCVLTVTGLVGVGALCSAVQTSAPWVPHSNAVATVAAVGVGIAGLPAIQVQAVEATAASSCVGSGGTTTIAFLKVGGVTVISKPTPIAPNTTLNIGVLKLVLNEQKFFTTPDRGVTVNAIHITANVLTLVKADIVIASAESDIGNCP